MHHHPAPLPALPSHLPPVPPDRCRWGWWPVLSDRRARCPPRPRQSGVLVSVCVRGCVSVCVLMGVLEGVLEGVLVGVLKGCQIAVLATHFIQRNLVC